MAQKAERTEPIVGRDDNDACERGKVLAVLGRKVRGRIDERARVEPDDHRRRPRMRRVRRPDIQLQAVFAPTRLTGRGVELRARRRGRCVQNGRRPDAAGCGGFHRRVPMGGAANGMPRNAHDDPRSHPARHPERGDQAGRPLREATRVDTCPITADTIARAKSLHFPP